jgi:hypothetical protein
MPTVYIETSIVSYLTARPSRDVVTLARQELTREWWNTRRHRHDLFTSDVVIGEAREGDDEAAQRRLQALRGLEELEVTSEAEDLATALLEEGPLPKKAAIDALHIAISAIEGDRVSPHVELHAHRQCSDAKTDRGGLSYKRRGGSDHVYPRGINGGVR